MEIFGRKVNQRVHLAAEDAAPAEGVTFTPDQFAAVAEALKLAEDSTPDDVVAAVAALAEAAPDEDETVEKVAASTGPAPVVIDGEVWQQMEQALKVGMSARSQEKRLAAEQVVDQAIRLGKASPTHRENLIRQYNLDPEKTVAKLSNMAEIPRVEMGYGRENPDKPAGWVR